jgi:hypothetical protein
MLIDEVHATLLGCQAFAITPFYETSVLVHILLLCLNVQRQEVEVRVGKLTVCSPLSLNTSTRGL